jgi:hypothetical protein
LKLKTDPLNLHARRTMSTVKDPQGAGQKGQDNVNTPKEVSASRSLFSSMRTIPTLSYTIQNILMSMGTIFVSFSSLVFTLMVVLPLSIATGMMPRDMLMKVPTNLAMRSRGRVVLIVGASRGIGMEVLKQYVPEPNTTVIAVAKDPGASTARFSPRVCVGDTVDVIPLDNLRNAIIHLGDTPATVQMETIDLSGSPKEIARAVEELDRQYGPISHMYAISGISNHLKNETAFNLVRAHRLLYFLCLES